MALQTDAVGCYPKFWNRDLLRTAGYGAGSINAACAFRPLHHTGSGRHPDWFGPFWWTSVREAGLSVGRYPDSNERRSLSQIMTNRCPQKVDPFAISI